MTATQVSVVNHEKDIISTLKNSLYPGASDGSIQMVLSYCRAAKIDPLLKSVHIVPMSIKEGERYQYRDVIMPGVGLHRIQAARTGEYAGVSEPEFGPTIQKTMGGVSMVYPEWCKVTVKRIVHGHICDFEATEYWIENYATAKKDPVAPNTMWRKRPFGQLAKCAEAQALRKAFPEAIGANPTAEEMEGKSIESSSMENHISPVSHNINLLKDLIEQTQTPQEVVQKWLEKAQVGCLEELSPVQISACANALREQLKGINECTQK